MNAAQLSGQLSLGSPHLRQETTRAFSHEEYTRAVSAAATLDTTDVQWPNQPGVYTVTYKNEEQESWNVGYARTPEELCRTLLIHMGVHALDSDDEIEGDTAFVMEEFSGGATGPLTEDVDPDWLQSRVCVEDHGDGRYYLLFIPWEGEQRPGGETSLPTPEPSGKEDTIKVRLTVASIPVDEVATVSLTVPAGAAASVREEICDEALAGHISSSVDAFWVIIDPPGLS